MIPDIETKSVTDIENFQNALLQKHMAYLMEKFSLIKSLKKPMLISKTIIFCCLKEHLLTPSHN